MACVMVVALALPASAQMCSADGGNLDCDTTYRDTKISCRETYEAKDKDGKTLTLPSVFPSCPKEPMPMRTTPKLSFIKDFSPYLYDFVRDTKDINRPYDGYISRGTKGDPSQTFAMIGKAPKNVSRQKGCVNQIDIPPGSTPEERAKLLRLQLDNCANQFILQTAVYPYHKVGSNLTCATEDDPTRRCAQEDMCQPLRMRTDTKQEYMPGAYIKAAWDKLLNNASARKTAGAPDEPHLPDGITLSKPIAPSPAADSVTLSALASTPYEEIIDPSHPFSPRWDYKWNDRDHYSRMTEPYMSKFHDNSKAVYCAGNRADSGDKAKDKEYKVDVLEFRREKFDKGTTNRINYNRACYNDKDTTKVKMLHSPYIMGVSLPTLEFTKMTAGAYCYKIVRPPIPKTPLFPGYPGDAQRQPCWKCFKLNGKVSDEGKGQLPPCTTRYDSADQQISGSYLPGGRNNFKREAVCMTNPLEKKTAMSQLCETLRAPYTPMNKLKMRYHNPEGKEEEQGGPKTVVLKAGVQEGLWHKEYFGNRMPYPRLWDVGYAIQRVSQDKQDPHDDTGQFTAIVGIGREGTTDEINEGLEEKDKLLDQRCLYGGWGDASTVGGKPIPKLPDPITSWTELKLYQANTTRETNVVCLGRYEKAFKHRSAENQLLVAAGAVRTGIVSTVCDRDSKGRTSNCVSKELGETEDGEEEQATDDKKYRSLQYIQQSWPLAWRGYMGDPDESKTFGQLTGGGGLLTGLDNAQCGDFILMPYGGATGADPKKRGLPKIARVKCEDGKRLKGKESAIKTIGSGKNAKHFIEVEEADNGKWPDVCGTTDVMGELKTRRIFKPGEMRNEIKETLKTLKWTTSCADQKLSECEMEPWSTLKVYRPITDVLNGDEEEDEGDAE